MRNNVGIVLPVSTSLHFATKYSLNAFTLLLHLLEIFHFQGVGYVCHILFAEKSIKYRPIGFGAI